MTIPITPLSDAEPLKPQDLVITLLGTYVRHRKTTVWSGGLVRLLQEFDFSPAASRVALMRMVDRDLLERVRNGRTVHYRLTGRCERLLADGDRRIFALGSETNPSGTWTGLYHDLPEERRLERGRLASRLRFLGFGSLRDAVWISPLHRLAQVDALIEELDIGKYCTVWLARPTRQPDAIVRTAWDLPALTDRYHCFAGEFTPALKIEPDDAEAFRVRTLLIHHYRGFAMLDPGLPDSEFDDPTARPAAVTLFNTLYGHLLPGAERYFDTLASGEKLAPESQTTLRRPRPRTPGR